MSKVSLQHCLAYADRVEQAVLALRVTSGPLAALPARCTAFRSAAEAIATNRGLDRLTLAFVGPRNAGKTTLASLLIRDPAIRGQLPVGLRPDESTRRILWIGPEPPQGLNEALETWVPCVPEALEDLGWPSQIVDVPGFNDRVAEVRTAADRALEAASIKVVVIDERDLEAFEVRDYLHDADGATLLPVVNRVTGITPADVAAFAAELRRTLRHARVLEPVVIPDHRQRGRSEAADLDAARSALVQALRAAGVSPAGIPALAQPQMTARWDRFRSEVLAAARAALPATAEAVQALDATEQRLPREVLQDVLGTDRALRAVLRQRLRAVWVDNTPALFFPWRLTLGLAHLVWGALDRIPLVLAGSVPSLISVAWTAARNLRRGEAFREATHHGLHQRVVDQSQERLSPLVRALRASLSADLGRAPGDRPPRDGQAQVEGIAALQERSALALEATVERHAPGRGPAVAAALIGCGLFWAVAGWPFYALYLDYFRAAEGTWGQVREALNLFPAPSLSLLLTAVLLGLLPMALWLLVTSTCLIRRGRIESCARTLRLDHEALVRTLLAEGLLRVRLEDRELAACRLLLNPAGTTAATTVAAAPPRDVSA